MAARCGPASCADTQRDCRRQSHRNTPTSRLRRKSRIARGSRVRRSTDTTIWQCCACCDRKLTLAKSACTCMRSQPQPVCRGGTAAPRHSACSSGSDSPSKYRALPESASLQAATRSTQSRVRTARTPIVKCVSRRAKSWFFTTAAWRTKGIHSPKRGISRMTATVWKRSMSSILPAVRSHSRPSASYLKCVSMPRMEPAASQPSSEASWPAAGASAAGPAPHIAWACVNLPPRARVSATSSASSAPSVVSSNCSASSARKASSQRASSASALMGVKSTAILLLQAVVP
mmetsp:Transcript_12630/g.37561  ORF Transcript_12630/g.37561 Transcript_12630/m.37561 type:complete len:289 (+) Transcript_12630:186-1052(+)